MTKVVVHPLVSHLPKAAPDHIPVQIYGLDGRARGDVAVVGHPLLDPLKRLGVRMSPKVFDFLTLALSVTAADTFVQRKLAADGWTREISLVVPLCEPEPWQAQKALLEETLHFLSGDIWTLELTEGGQAPPHPYRRRDRYRLIKIRGLDSVSLFSGGLDSAIGAIDLLQDGRRPLLVSHAYQGDRAHQISVAAQLSGIFFPFLLNANPISSDGARDITMRTRSFNFLAFGAIGAYAISIANRLDQVPLYIPENGFISLNAPLTPRRLGSLSTRTTHPHFLNSVQSIFDGIGIPAIIVNPYQFKTKGEMLKECADQDTLQAILSKTVSCSNWKRKKQQCGRCVPCLIRRAAIYAANLAEPPNYLYQNLKTVQSDEANRDDLFAMISAIKRRTSTSIERWIMNSGPLPSDVEIRRAYKQIFIRGLEEVEQYLKSEGILQ